MAKFEYQAIAASDEATTVSSKKRYYGVVAAIGTLCSFAIAAVFFTEFTTRPEVVLQGVGSDSLFDDVGRYILREFDIQKPMSNFLAGLGGFWGVPMWVFYVNRGQGVTSFGVQNKDGAISLFKTAEKAYQQTAFNGFRTFVKGTNADGATWQHMPFSPRISSDESLSRNMMIGMNEMEIEEVAESVDLQTNVLYYTLTDEEFPALIRKTTFTNLGESDVKLEVLDGLAQLVPAGLSNWAEFAMGRTMEAWMKVYNVDDKDFRFPFFHITQGFADVTTVQPIYEGHFAVAYVETDGDRAALPFLVDPTVVFGADTNLLTAGRFFSSSASLSGFMKKSQGTVSRTPCAFAGASFTIAPLQNVTLVSIYGHSRDLNAFKSYQTMLLNPALDSKLQAARNIVETITAKVAAKTGVPLMDAYVRQTYLDDVLRGGLPVLIGSQSENSKVYHTFSRIHGDIERDYNNFQIDTTYFSQGPGNFRDVCQNRRLDVVLSPWVDDFDIRMFLSFIQADGFNPLTVASTNLKVYPEQVAAVVDKIGVTGQHRDAVIRILSQPYRIGQFFADMKGVGVGLEKDREEIVQILVDSSQQEFAAQFAQNGFWADHWTYTLDLINSFVSIFPEKEEHMLWDGTPLPFFMSPAIVKTRNQRLVVHTDISSGLQSVHLDNAILVETDVEYPVARKLEMLEITKSPEYIADQWGAGGTWQRDAAKQTFRVTAIAKLFMLGVIKFSSLDPSGLGIEMEGGKPGWNDAMNGLPGLLGSGMPETFEMLLVLNYVKSAIARFQRPVSVPIEFFNFLEALRVALQDYMSNADNSNRDFVYWDLSNKARERYRADVAIQFAGETLLLQPNYLVSVLSTMQQKTQEGIQKAKETNPSGVMPTYFYHECDQFDVLTTSDPLVFTANPKSFKMHTVQLFLEGPTRYLKVLDSTDAVQEQVNTVKSSPLYDSELKMFMISESLVNMSSSMGRMKAFSAGWLENQSIWLHMSYKYYLELLRGKLYDVFFDEIQHGLVPFMDNHKYGRSPLEATSFIVSSAFPDPKLHGTGFLARLSGSTAEFLSMWSIITIGHQPFRLNDEKQLLLELKPVIPSWLFDESGHVTFTFLGTTQVIYINPARLNTWLVEVTSISVFWRSGDLTVFESSTIVGDFAMRVRQGDAEKIEVHF